MYDEESCMDGEPDNGSGLSSIAGVVNTEDRVFQI